MAATLLLIACAASASAALLWIACDRLGGSAQRLADHHGIPAIVKGSVIMAVSSSIPELATAVLAIPVHGDFELGLAAIIGSAIYNVLVIPACSVFARGHSLRSNRELVFREALFYLVSVVVLLLVICLAVVYDGVGGEPGAEIRGTFTRPLALLPLLLYGLYLFMQYEEVRDYRRKATRTKGIRPAREWLILGLSIGLICVGVEVLLRCAVALGELLDTPTFLWGMTIVAAATSIPDTLISVREAKLGRSDASVSNVLGSNVFDLLVAVPVAVLIAGSVGVSFTQTVPMMSFLVLATIVLLVFMRRDMELTRTEASLMLLLYLVFGLWMAAEAFGITSVLGLSG
jgi:cation:H+ antiporter